jgi:hypothetical protein
MIQGLRSSGQYDKVYSLTVQMIPSIAIEDKQNSQPFSVEKGRQEKGGEVFV